jgi:hydroxylaminobenzene mutase
MPDRKRSLLWHGALLFLLGLVTGLIQQKLTNPRMGLSAHLEGLMNGTFLIAIGAAWHELKLAPRKITFTYWTVLYGTYGNWAFTLIAAMFGTAAMTPLASAGHKGLDWQEGVVTFGFVSVGLAMLVAVVMLLVGYKRQAATLLVLLTVGCSSIADRGEPVTVQMTPEDRVVWGRAVATYTSNYVNRDFVRDEGRVAIKEVLRGVRDREPLPEIPNEPGLRVVLEEIEAIYQKYWWPAHDTMHRSRIAAAQPLQRYGERLSVSAGSVGAYTMLFHETLHQWGRTIAIGIRNAATVRNKEVPLQFHGSISIETALDNLVADWPSGS